VLPAVASRANAAHKNSHSYAQCRPSAHSFWIKYIETSHGILQTLNELPIHCYEQQIAWISLIVTGEAWKLLNSSLCSFHQPLIPFPQVPNILLIILFSTSQDISDDIGTGHGLDGQGSIPGRGKRCFWSSQCPHRIWGPNTLLSNGHLGFFCRGKRPGRDADHTPPSNAEVKNGAIPLLSHTPSWNGA
jgi:hypothetical protein